VRTFKGFASSRHRHKAFESLESFRIVLSYGRIVAAMAMLLANLLLAVLAAGQSLTPGTGRIVGRVVDAETGAPVAGVRVYLNGPVSPTAPWPPGPLPLPPPVAPQGRQTPATPPPQPDASFFLTLQRLTSETRADGVFEIRDVPNARWAIVAQKEGFIPNRGTTVPLIEMEAGRTLTAPDIRLDRGGVITGRILDARGNPLSRVQVRTTQFSKQPGGAIRTTGGSSTVETNDRGEFRLSGVQPGVHYVIAQPPPAAIPMIGGTTPPQSSSTYVATFYPGLSDAASASPVNVLNGKTTNGIEFSLSSVAAYQVSGIVVDAAGRPVGGAIVRLPSRMPFGPPFLSSAPSDANGRFRITNVPAGTYALMAAVPRVTVNGNGGVSGGLSFGDAARPGAAPEVTIQGDTGNLRVVVSQP
jgi:protocatechuate 3,4-dioxygenase beta subunit